MVYLAGVSEFVAILPAKVQSVEAVFLHRIEEIRLFGVILSRKSRKPSMGRPLVVKKHIWSLIVVAGCKAPTNKKAHTAPSYDHPVARVGACGQQF